MDVGIRNRLIKEAVAIEQLSNFHSEEQEWLLPLLSKGIRTAIEMLDLISDDLITFEEIANKLDVSALPVSQKLNALAIGGIDIQLTDTAGQTHLIFTKLY